MGRIDLDAIIKEHMPFVIHGNSPGPYIGARQGLKEAIRQALVLATENAQTTDNWAGDKMVDKQSILEVIDAVE